MHELIGSLPEFAHLQGVTILALWKKKGGVKNGEATLGACKPTSGLLKFVTRASFTFWMAADNCRDGELEPWQLEALLHHELMHADVVENESTGETKAATRGHDIEEFRGTLERYGCWKPDVKEFVKAARQLKLDEVLS